MRSPKPGDMRILTPESNQLSVITNKSRLCRLFSRRSGISNMLLKKLSKTFRGNYISIYKPAPTLTMARISKTVPNIVELTNVNISFNMDVSTLFSKIIISMDEMVFDILTTVENMRRDHNFERILFIQKDTQCLICSLANIARNNLSNGGNCRIGLDQNTMIGEEYRNQNTKTECDNMRNALKIASESKNLAILIDDVSILFELFKNLATINYAEIFKRTSETMGESLTDISVVKQKRRELIKKSNDILDTLRRHNVTRGDSKKRKSTRQ